MKRWRRLALASAATGALACSRPPAGPAALGVELEIRVGLAVSVERVTLGGDGELFLTEDRGGALIGSIPAGLSWTAVTDTAGLRLVRPDGSRSTPYRGISAVNVSEGRFAGALGRRYRGRIGVFRDARGLTLVNRVPLESYVAGVAGAEMGTRRPDEVEALRAQVVVSRTFALKHRGRWESLGFDLHNDTRDQVYGGVASESPVVWSAVRATAGEVLEYRGAPVDAFFHSTCGYETAGAEEVFRTSRPLPYLRPVSDARGGGGYYCDISPRFRWREQWDAAQLRAILSQTLPAVAPVAAGGLQPIVDLEVQGTTRSGRVAQLLIRFAHGEVRVNGSDVRQILRPAPDRYLGSAAFQLHVTRSGDAVTRLVAAGAGWGHGVGLCQWGAVGRARAGQGYRKILATYFPGTTIDRLN